MRYLLLFLTLTLGTHGSEWVDLFDGETLDGWVIQGDVNWAVTDGAITADKGENSLLTTEKKYLNYELELEFKAERGGNSGVFLNTKPVAIDPLKDCYEVNISPPDNAFPTGSLVGHVKVSGGESDQWRSYRLKIEDGTVTVALEGVTLLQHTVEDPLPPGFVGLQKNVGAIAFRNIRIRELD